MTMRTQPTPATLITRRPQPRSSLALAGLAWLLAALVHPAGASAQGTTVFPTILDLHQGKVGDWAEYALTVPNGKMQQKLAIVSRDEKSTTLEMSVQGGPMAAMGTMLIQVKIPRDPKLESRPTSVVMQVGKNVPMEMPKDHPMVPKESFKRLNPNDLQSKSETIKVTAGTFTCKRHLQKRGNDQATTWLSEKATPLGLVKMESTTPMGLAKVELVKMGQGAKSSLTAKPVPFDQNVFMQQVMAGMGGAKK